MQEFGLSEVQVVDTFNTGTVEAWTNGNGFNSVKKFHNYEVGVAYFRDERGIYKITTVWKRIRR